MKLEDEDLKAVVAGAQALRRAVEQLEKLRASQRAVHAAAQAADALSEVAARATAHAKGSIAFEESVAALQDSKNDE